MAKGKVKWFNTTKGYGFIEPDEGGSDAFIHICSVKDAGLSELVEAQAVEYDMEEAKYGKLCAMNIKLVD